ncbi:MAG: energy-coupling factor transporter ATPase [Lachnospiraceae bacterium]|nr:energy-coupling factor transporter ATPase [Lachnospiraceae bacterium]
MIRFEDVAFEYIRRDEEGNVEGITRALDGVSVHIRKGEFVAVLGANGSGKSTFAKHINGLLIPGEGSVRVGGYDTKDEENLLKVRQMAGMVFQNPDNQIIAQTVEEDVAFGLENMGIPTDQMQARVDEALEKVGLTEEKKSSPNRLSGGQKQRVAIAGVLAMKPECIIFDESTAMLDPAGRREVLSTAHELNRQQGITVILITHYMNEAVGADRILVMDRGRIAMDGKPRDIFSKVDELKKLKLDVPPVTELAHRLRKSGMPMPVCVLTEDEFLEAVNTNGGWLPQGGLKYGKR